MAIPARDLMKVQDVPEVKAAIDACDEAIAACREAHRAWKDADRIVEQRATELGSGCPPGTGSRQARARTRGDHPMTPTVGEEVRVFARNPHVKDPDEGRPEP